MIVRTRGHLWRMGDADYLAAFGKVSQYAPYRISCGATYTDIGFIQNQATI